MVGIEFIRICQPVGVCVFIAIYDSIPVGVFEQRPRAKNVQLIRIAQPIPVGVGHNRVRVEGIEFINVTQAVRVGILVPVIDSIPIRVPG